MFLNAFLLGGAICMFFQLLIMITRIDPPRILIFGFVLGAILTATGLVPALSGFGGMGIDAMVLGAGSAVEATAEGLLNGVPAPFFLIVGTLAGLAVIGLCGGLIRAAIKGKK
jgi:stage V sporulation protein AE